MRQVRKKVTISEVKILAPKISDPNTKRYLTIIKNTGIFFAFKLDFNRYIQKAKKFFSNIDTNFFALTDVDAQSK